MRLKSCPFCGNKPEAVQDENPRQQRYAHVKRRYVLLKWWYVHCRICNTLFGYDHDYGGNFDSKEKAVLAWNERFVEQPQSYYNENDSFNLDDLMQDSRFMADGSFNLDKIFCDEADPHFDFSSN
jgi:hypothetical protein